MKKLRSEGWSLPEIHERVRVGYGTVHRYIRDVEILPRYKDIWYAKRRGSVKRKIRAEEEASGKAKKIVENLNGKEKVLFISALYWGEGSKGELVLTNSDPDLIKFFVRGLREVLEINEDRFRLHIRIYEDLDREKCLRFWSKVTGLPEKNFVSVDVLKGRKTGKLKYGMCKVRISKGGDLLKYLKAVKNEAIIRF